MSNKSRKAAWNQILLKEEKIDMRMRRKEYNRKIRHAKISEDSCDRGYNKMLRNLYWVTMA